MNFLQNKKKQKETSDDTEAENETENKAAEEKETEMSANVVEKSEDEEKIVEKDTESETPSNPDETNNEVWPSEFQLFIFFFNYFLQDLIHNAYLVEKLFFLWLGTLTHYYFLWINYFAGNSCDRIYNDFSRITIN